MLKARLKLQILQLICNPKYANFEEEIPTKNGSEKEMNSVG